VRERTCVRNSMCACVFVSVFVCVCACVTFNCRTKGTKHYTSNQHSFLTSVVRNCRAVCVARCNVSCSQNTQKSSNKKKENKTHLPPSSVIAAPCALHAAMCRTCLSAKKSTVTGFFSLPLPAVPKRPKSG
jgi:hypothetical protein